MGHLTVEFPPTFQHTTMTEAWSWDMKAANLTCRAEAIPNATIAWFLEGTPELQIQEGPNVRIIGLQSESTLEVTKSLIEWLLYSTLNEITFVTVTSPIWINCLILILII